MVINSKENQNLLQTVTSCCEARASAFWWQFL